MITALVIASACTASSDGPTAGVTTVTECGNDATVTVRVTDVSLDAERDGGSFAGAVVAVPGPTRPGPAAGDSVVVVVGSDTTLRINGTAVQLGALPIGATAKVVYGAGCSRVEEGVLFGRSVDATT